MAQSELTIEAAVRRFHVRAETLRELLEAGRIDGARRRPRSDHGADNDWVIPVAALEALGYPRRGRQVAVYPRAPARPFPWSHWARWAAGGALAMLVLLPLLVVLGSGPDDDPTDLTTAVAARTEPRERVGVAGDGRDAVARSGRIPVGVDERTPSEDLPRIVVVSEGASRASIDRYVGDERARPVQMVEGRFWLVASAGAAAPVPPEPVGPPTSDLASPPTSTEEPSTTSGGSPTTESVPAGAGSVTSADPGIIGPPAPQSTTTIAPNTSTTASTTSTTTSTSPGSPTTTLGPAPAPDAEPSTADEGADRLRPGSSVVVGEGEHFWAVAEAAVLAEDPVADPSDIAAYWTVLVAANLDILVEPGNADLLLVGQSVELPPLTT